MTSFYIRIIHNKQTFKVLQHVEGLFVVDNIWLDANKL